MAREKTVELCRRIHGLLGCDVADSNRLTKLDSDIWRLNLIKNSAKLKIETTSKRRFFGFSQATQSEQEIDVDEKVFKRIIAYYEEEYKNQVKVCEELIRKLESD